MKALLLTIGLVIMGSQTASAQERFAAGVIIGAPTALSAQIRYPSANTLDILFASNLAEDLFLQCHYDYRIATLKEEESGIYSIGLYAGPGLFLRSSAQKKNNLGASGNVGFSWLFRSRYEFFLEYSPKISFIYPAASELTGGFGFRYVF